MVRGARLPSHNQNRHRRGTTGSLQARSGGPVCLPSPSQRAQSAAGVAADSLPWPLQPRHQSREPGFSGFGSPFPRPLHRLHLTVAIARSSRGLSMMEARLSNQGRPLRGDCVGHLIGTGDSGICLANQVDGDVGHYGSTELTSAGPGLIGRSAGVDLALLAASDTPILPIEAVVSFYGPTVSGTGRPPRLDPVDILRIGEALLGGSPDELLAAYRDASSVTCLTQFSPPTVSSTAPAIRSSTCAVLHDLPRRSGVTTVFLEIPWAEHAFDAEPNGPSAQIALYVADRLSPTGIERRRTCGSSGAGRRSARWFFRRWSFKSRQTRTEALQCGRRRAETTDLEPRRTASCRSRTAIARRRLRGGSLTGPRVGRRGRIRNGAIDAGHSMDGGQRARAARRAPAGPIVVLGCCFWTA